MSDIIIGKKGSGKTYFAVKNYVLPALIEDRNVFTNLDLGYHPRSGEPDLSWIPGYKYSDYLRKDVRGLLHTFRKHDDLLDRIKMDFQNDINGESLRVPPRSVIVIDEAHDIFYYLYANQIDKRVYNFFAYARHFDIRLVFISQAIGLMAKFVEQLADDVYHIKSLSSYGLGRNTIKVMRFSSVHAQEADEENIVRYDTSIFNLYRSSVVPESMKRVRFPLWVYFPLIAVVLAVIFFMSSRGRTYFW